MLGPFQEIQRHYHEAYTASKDWHRLKYHTLAKISSSNQNHVFLIDGKNLYSLQLVRNQRLVVEFRAGTRFLGFGGHCWSFVLIEQPYGDLQNVIILSIEAILT